MARIGGRSLWLAVPAGLLCAAVVAALVWLAAPMVPVLVQWAGDSLRTSSAATREADEAPSPAELVAGGLVMDCRDVYPDVLWAELIWHGDVLLGQSTSRPPISLPGLADALAPTVHLTCTWTFGGGASIVSTVASVDPEAAPVAEAALRGEGFTCSGGDALTCTNAAAGSRETHVLRDGLWLASVRDGWEPDGYDVRLADFVWK